MDANDWNKRYATDELVYTDKVNMFVEEHTKDLKPGKAIDIAGGEGRNSVWLAERGWNTENIDFSDVALKKFLEFAESRGVADRCLATCADATQFESVLAPVDLAIIAYLQIPKDALAQSIHLAVSSLKPAGTLFGVWHALENLAAGNRGPQDPAVLPTVESLTEMLAEEPVKVEFVRNEAGFVKTADGLKPSVTVILKATRL